MMTLMTAALALLMLALGILLWLFDRLSKRLLMIEQALQALQSERGSFPADFRKLLSSDSCELISIQLLNPMELAAQQSKLASALGSLTPSLIRRIVHNEAIKITRKELERHGAKAQVRYHGAG